MSGLPAEDEYMPIPNAMIDYNRFIKHEFLFYTNNYSIDNIGNWPINSSDNSATLKGTHDTFTG